MGGAAGDLGARAAGFAERLAIAPDAKRLAGVLGLEPRVAKIRHVDMAPLDAAVRLGDRLAAGSRLFAVGVESLELARMRRRVALGGGQKVGVMQPPVHRRLRHRLVPAGLRIALAAECRALLFPQRRGKLRDRQAALVSRRAWNAAGSSPPRCLGRHPLFAAMARTAFPALARAPRAFADLEPPARELHAPAMARTVRERFRQNRRMAERPLPVRAQAGANALERMARRIRMLARPAEHRQARAVRDRIKPPPLPLRHPADPGIARLRLQRARLPPAQAQPPPVALDNMAQAATREALEAELAMARHQLVPQAAFAGPRKTRRHLSGANAAPALRMLLACRKSHGRISCAIATKKASPARKPMIENDHPKDCN